MSATLTQVFHEDVMVDCSRSLAKGIEAGEYDRISPGITERHFSIERGENKRLWLTLFRLDYQMTSDNLIETINEQGWHPAKIEALLALGEHHPCLQRELLIVAPDSPDGCCDIPALWGNSCWRILGLRRLFGEWWYPAGCHFLAFRN